MRRWTIGLGLLILMLIGVAGYSGYTRAQALDASATTAPPTVAVTRGDVRQSMVAPGVLVGSHENVLGFAVAGQVVSVDVRAGERVIAGQALAQVEMAPLRRALATAQAALEAGQREQARLLAEAELSLRLALLQAQEVDGVSAAEWTAAQANLTAAQAALAALLAGPDPAGVALAQAEFANAAATLRLAQAAYDQIGWRADAGMLPQAVDLERATNAFNAARARYDQATADSDPDLVAAAQARVRQAEAEVDQLRRRQSSMGAAEAAQIQVEQAQLAVDHLRGGVDPALKQAVFEALQQMAAATLRAPFDGVVLAVNVTQGETVSAGQPVVMLADPLALEVAATVIEEDLPLVVPDQAVELYFDAAPDASVRGRVARIVPQRASDERPLYPVYIAVDTIPAGLLPGMTVDGEIVIAERRDVLQLPRSLVRAQADGTADVEIWRNGAIERRTVQVGLRGDVYVEIVGGLAEGEQVVGR